MRRVMSPDLIYSDRSILAGKFFANRGAKTETDVVDEDPENCFQETFFDPQWTE